ncbi:MAG: tRNA (adenosine(37)-N6)-threonylcarbamoyltransferase complex dimerization subunit type 1 TsaB, partial [Verrucomicrobiaceae bacterium]|nr:tRNA (adenosine(37)-N6)-threonylcarbamoyltransferase complex dimerization subunit type 1 TsaB [Verrucomicrobiaceae bacterium]
MGAGYRIAIETSVSHGSVALCIKGEIIFSSEFEAGRRPSELLPRILQEALGHVGSGSVELVLIGTGPGSYNGARVGIASGQGIAIVHQCPVVGISS